MTTLVFLGPSLGRTEAASLLNATYLPPARRGDMVRAAEQHGATSILLIDGYFEQIPSPWHKEILFLIKNGVLVAGAASMGALRAAELDQFGMVGVGKIYDAYKSGHFADFDDPFDGDDEVAVVHGPAEAGYPSTTSLVDMRLMLKAARDEKIIDTDIMQTLATIAKGQFYKTRTWRSVLDAARLKLPGFPSARFNEWLQVNALSQKSLDAASLLRHYTLGDLSADVPPFRFESTLLWESQRESLLEPGKE